MSTEAPTITNNEIPLAERLFESELIIDAYKQTFPIAAGERISETHETAFPTGINGKLEIWFFEYKKLPNNHEVVSFKKRDPNLASLEQPLYEIHTGGWAKEVFAPKQNLISDLINSRELLGEIKTTLKMINPNVFPTTPEELDKRFNQIDTTPQFS